MAWPPPVLPINRTNATPSQDTHPQDHNAVNLAVNELVTRVQYVEGAFVYVGGDVMTGTLNVGPGNPFAVPPANVVGVGLAPSGAIGTCVQNAGETNLYCVRHGNAFTWPQNIIDFVDSSHTIRMGAIQQSGYSTVAYVTTSDPRLKERTGDVADAAELVQTLGHEAFRGRWIQEDGTGAEWVFLSSTDIQAVAPYAVSGEADAVHPTGEIDAQQVNYPALVPLLTAALAQALDRIDALEARDA